MDLYQHLKNNGFGASAQKIIEAMGKKSITLYDWIAKGEQKIAKGQVVRWNSLQGEITASKIREIVTMLMPKKERRAREGTGFARTLLKGMSRQLPIEEDQIKECKEARDTIAKSKDSQSRLLLEALHTAEKTWDRQMLEVALGIVKDYLKQDAKGKAELLPQIKDYIEVWAGWKD